MKDTVCKALLVTLYETAKALSRMATKFEEITACGALEASIAAVDDAFFEASKKTTSNKTSEGEGGGG